MVGARSTRSAASIIKDDLELFASSDFDGHRPAQGGKRRRRRPARPPHRQHPDPRDRHRDRGEPVRPAQSYRDPKSPLAAMSWGAEDLSAALGASSKYDADGELELHLQAGAVAVPRRRGRGGSAAGRRRVRRLQGRRRPASGSRSGAARGLHRQARDPPGPGARSSTPPSRRPRTRCSTPRRSSPRSRHSPTRACCRSAAKWSIARTWCRRRRVLERSR